MSEDPKYTIKKIVDGITLKKDDELTAATLIFIYADGPETLKELFETYDVIVMFEDAKGVGTRYIQNVPVHHPETYPVCVSTLDKYSAGVLVCTADAMQEKMKVQMRTMIEAAAKNVAYRLRIATEIPKTLKVAGLKIWETTYALIFEDL